MKICPNHWHEVKNSIRERGLWGLVTPGGYLAANKSPQELEREAAESTLVPLIAASLMIAEQARMAFESYPVTGSDCPLCEVEQNLGDGSAIEWIDTDADLILQVCRERELVPSEAF